MTKHKHFAAILILAAASLGVRVAEAAIPQSERDVLLQIFSATNGASWTSSLGWGGAAGTECQWGGVHCDSAGQHVTGLWLAQDNLVGTLPDLSGLPQLQEFVANGNALTGQLPSLVSLTSLVFLDLANNRLTGNIPSLSGLTQLQHFQLSGNQLTGSLPSLAGLSQMEFFGVSSNQLTGNIPPLSDLAQVQGFYVSGNKLTGSMPSLTGLTQLQYIDVSSNQLSGTLPSLDGLTTLRSVAVDTNQFTGSLPSLSGLTHLYYFSASNNRLSGPIPAFSGVPGLSWFKVGNNRLSGSIPNLDALTGIQTFDVSNNALTGTMSSLNALKLLSEIDLDGNALTGDLPDASKTILAGGRSAVCPNAFTRKDNLIWDFATGLTPWHVLCGNFSNPDQHGVTGTWYTASKSGQGFILEVYPDLVGAGRGVLAGGWFTYVADPGFPSSNAWFTIQGETSSATPYARVGIYRAIGGNFNAGPSIGAASVGDARFLMIDCTHAELAYSLYIYESPYNTGLIPLTRLDSNVTCGQQGDNGASPSTFLLSGAWYDPAKSGQGLFFDINPVQQILFAAWYTFSQDRTSDSGQRWFTLQAPFVNGAVPTMNIPIYSSSGGYLNYKYPTEGAVVTTPVGTANLTLASCTSFTLTYSFTTGEFVGKSGTINLQRVGPTPANCHVN